MEPDTLHGRRDPGCRNLARVWQTKHYKKLLASQAPHTGRPKRSPVSFHDVGFGDPAGLVGNRLPETCA